MQVHVPLEFYLDALLSRSFLSSSLIFTTMLRSVHTQWWFTKNIACHYAKQCTPPSHINRQFWYTQTDIYMYMYIYTHTRYKMATQMFVHTGTCTHTIPPTVVNFGWQNRRVPKYHLICNDWTVGDHPRATLGWYTHVFKGTRGSMVVHLQHESKSGQTKTSLPSNAHHLVTSTGNFGTQRHIHTCTCILGTVDTYTSYICAIHAEKLAHSHNGVDSIHLP